MNESFAFYPLFGLTLIPLQNDSSPHSFLQAVQLPLLTPCRGHRNVLLLKVSKRF